jgi:hypothetical protein
MKIPVTLALALDVRAGLDQLAAREDMSRSTTANRLLREALVARDALPTSAVVVQMLAAEGAQA